MSGMEGRPGRLQIGPNMANSEAYEHPDETDMLREQTNSGISLVRAGRARLSLALPSYRGKIEGAQTLAFRSLCSTYEVAALMVDKLRKETACREELLQDYCTLSRGVETDAIAMLDGKKSDRWRIS